MANDVKGNYYKIQDNCSLFEVDHIRATSNIIRELAWCVEQLIIHLIDKLLTINQTTNQVIEQFIDKSLANLFGDNQSIEHLKQLFKLLNNKFENAQQKNIDDSAKKTKKDRDKEKSKE